MDVYRWAQTAPIGGKLIYYNEIDQWPPARRCAVMETARVAHDNGMVFLVQRRVKRGRARGTFQYEAHRISKPVAILLGLLPRPPRPSYARGLA